MGFHSLSHNCAFFSTSGEVPSFVLKDRMPFLNAIQNSTLYKEVKSCNLCGGSVLTTMFDLVGVDIENFLSYSR